MADITEDQRLPLWQRRCYVLLAFACIALLSGILYGWPSMRAILRRDGVLEPSECRLLSEGEQCVPQELAFGLIFTVGNWANQGGRLFAGIVLDKVGPRWTASGCALIFCVGMLIFALLPSTAGMAVGCLLLGVGGAGVQLSLQCASALFPRNRSLVMSSFSGAFQMGSAVFLLFDLLHSEADFARVGLLLGYVAVGVAVAAVTASIWPSQPFGLVATPPAGLMVGEKGEVETSSLPLNLRPYREQALSTEYLLFLIFFTVNALSLNFTISTVGTQFDLMVGDGTGSSETTTRIFNLFFSLSFLFTPIMGSLIDRLGFPPVLAAVNTLSIGVSACLLVPDLRAQYVTSIFYSLGRVGVWASFFSFNGATFGFRNYGKLAGGGLMFGACFSLLQYPLLDLTLGYFEEDFSFVNSLFIVLSALQYPLLVKLAYCMRTQRLADEAFEQSKAQQRSSDSCPAPCKGSGGLTTLSILPSATEAKTEPVVAGKPEPNKPLQASGPGSDVTRVRGMRNLWRVCTCSMSPLVGP